MSSSTKMAPRPPSSRLRAGCARSACGHNRSRDIQRSTVITARSTPAQYLRRRQHDLLRAARGCLGVWVTGQQVLLPAGGSASRCRLRYYAHGVALESSPRTPATLYRSARGARLGRTARSVGRGPADRDQPPLGHADDIPDPARQAGRGLGIGDSLTDHLDSAGPLTEGATVVGPGSSRRSTRVPVGSSSSAMITPMGEGGCSPGSSNQAPAPGGRALRPVT